MSQASVVGVGVDIVDTSRVNRALARWPDQYLRRLFSDRERGEWPIRDATFVAGAIALKEASYKSVSTHVPRPSWQDIELMRSMEATDSPAVLRQLVATITSTVAGARFQFVATQVRELDEHTMVNGAWAVADEGAVAVAIAFRA